MYFKLDFMLEYSNLFTDWSLIYIIQTNNDKQLLFVFLKHFPHKIPFYEEKKKDQNKIFPFHLLFYVIRFLYLTCLI